MPLKFWKRSTSTYAPKFIEYTYDMQGLTRLATNNEYIATLLTFSWTKWKTRSWNNRHPYKVCTHEYRQVFRLQ